MKRYLEYDETKTPHTLTESPSRILRFWVFQEYAGGIADELPQIPPISKDALRATKAMIGNERGTKCDLI
jgi:hypothetical protein